MEAEEMERISRSWALAKASYRVLRADRELVVFPLISFVALAAVLLSFALPLALVGVVNLDTGELSPAGVVIGFVFYVVAYAVTFFFNTALVGAAMIRLNGGDPTVSDGIRIAMSRLPAIIGYALIAATVGMILRWISERAGIVGAIVAGILGFAWSVATFLVVPVLVVEKVGPVEAVKRSSAMLKKTWGEQLVGGFGIGLAFGLIMFAVAIIGAALIVGLAAISTPLMFVGIVLLIMALGAVGLVAAALGGIYTAAVYRYATTGEAGDFGTDALSAAFRQKEPSRVGGLLGR
jgi:Family of unknown function (DUF6159)